VQRLGGVGPFLLRADELLLLRVAGRQLQVEVAEPEVGEQVEHEAQQLPELPFELLGGAEDVGVVHGQAADAGQAVQDPGLLVAVHGAELEQRHGQLAVAAAP
jgi:hypothetical protein